MPDITPSTDLLLVPSAVVVPDELRLDVGSVPTGMISLQGQPMLERIAEAYADYDVTRVVAVDEAADSVRQYVSRSDYEWTVVDVTGTESLGETIHATLDVFDADDLENCGTYVNFADTLVSPIRPVSDGDYVPYSVEDRTYRWTTFDIEDGHIGSVTRKYEQSGMGPRPAFVGQFGIGDAAAFKQQLENTPRSDGLPQFYSALLSYLSDRAYVLYEPDEWFDVGHLDTYHQAKKEFLSVREFNELHIDGAKNVITKRSDDVSTLIDEITWYNEIPSELQPYLPRLYDCSTDPDDPYVKMEYVGYLSLSDLQLYGSHGRHIWNTIFHRLFRILEEFGEYTIDDEPESISAALESMYVEKTRRRLATLRDDDRFVPFFEGDSVSVNGVERPSLAHVLDDLGDIVRRVGLLNRSELTVIHGDLCLPNILYDPRNQIVKLIDPRGAFGKYTTHGDPAYDLAKLRHSFVGHYEHLINGQFEASAIERRGIDYEIYLTDAQRGREERFDVVLAEQSDVPPKHVELIEALLFLSMVPLHRDSYDRQLCMLAQGLEKVDPYLD